MSAPSTEIPHATGELTQNQAIERLLAREQSGQAPKPRTPEEILDDRDDEETVDLEIEAQSDDGAEVDVESDELSDDDSDDQTASKADPIVKFDDGTEVPMSEVKRGFLRQQDYTRKTQEVAAERRTVETERATYLAEKKRISDQLTPLIANAISIIDNPSTQQELAELRVTDPGAYAVRVMEMQQKQAQLQQLQAHQEYLRQSAEAEEAQRFKAERAQIAEQSRKTLIENIPAFKKDFSAEYSKLGKYVLEQGVPAEAWDAEVDHRVVTLAWKAMQYDLATRKTQKTSDQLRKAPQPLRPGAAKPAGHAQARALREATERAAASGSFDDAVALQLAKMKSRR